MWQKAIDRSPVNPSPRGWGFRLLTRKGKVTRPVADQSAGRTLPSKSTSAVAYDRTSVELRRTMARLRHWPLRAETVGHWPNRPVNSRGRQERSRSVHARTRMTAAAPRCGDWAGRTIRQPEERAIGKFEVPAVDLDLTLPAAFPLDHEFRSHRKTIGKPVCTVRHDTLLKHREPALPMCRSSNRLPPRRCYPRYPQCRSTGASGALPCGNRAGLAAADATC